ncbi:chemotaxis protein [Streptomyces laurentii]|uniref:Chemotaxis protein n=1 Tax=Streptomyces laurentii TaxID=39478 RepID=A0A169P7L8_STRLU|nr:chemotaxis protein [Streptomyces laurentii]
MPRDRRCHTCHTVTSVNGAPTVVVAVVDGQDVYACAAHRAEHAAPAHDPLVALAQYQDMAARPYTRPR